MGDMREKCAVAGASTSNSEVDATDITFLALDAQQHRGDAASGIASLTLEGKFDIHKGPGLVKDVYTPEILARLSGMTAIGQDRYPTSRPDEQHDQPVDDWPLRFALGHNGNLSETTELESFLNKSHIPTDHINDTEMATFGIAKFMRSGKDLPEAVEAIYPMLNGAFSCVAIQGDTVIAFRDPLGIRPLSLGAIQDGHMVASETCGFYPTRAKNLGIIEPGEMVIMHKGEIERRQIVTPNPKLDIFEIVYFSRIDSELFGESVGQMRYRLGKELAEQYPLDDKDYLVVGAPDSATPIAEGYANARGLEHRQVIMKNRFRGGRSFQQPNQAERLKYLDLKFSYVSGAIKDRDIIVIDDSIVRLNTAKKLYELMMRAQAKSVSFLIGSPPIGFPDFSGIDTPDQSKLIAAEHSPEQIRQMLGCSFLGYLSLSRMIRATGQPAEVFNLASFTGEYPYKIIDRDVPVKDPVSLQYLEERH